MDEVQLPHGRLYTDVYSFEHRLTYLLCDGKRIDFQPDTAMEYWSVCINHTDFQPVRTTITVDSVRLRYGEPIQEIELMTTCYANADTTGYSRYLCVGPFALPNHFTGSFYIDLLLTIEDEDGVLLLERKPVTIHGGISKVRETIFVGNKVIARTDSESRLQTDLERRGKAIAIDIGSMATVIGGEVR